MLMVRSREEMNKALALRVVDHVMDASTEP